MWATFAIGFIFASSLWQWNDGHTIAMIVVWDVLLDFYTLQQMFCIFTTPENRSFPSHLLRSQTQVLLYITTTCTNTCMFFTTYYTPIYFQFTQNNTSLMAAVQLLPYLLLLLTITFNLASGWALPKIKYYMPMCPVLCILMTVAMVLFMAYLSLSTPTRHIYSFSILMGAGTGITMQLDTQSVA